MRRSIGVSVLIVTALIALPTSSRTSQTQLAPALLEEMKMLEGIRTDAIRTMDLTTLQRLYSDDFIGTASNGQCMTRTELFDVFRRQPDGLIGASDDIAIRSLGPDTVIVIGRLTITRARDPQSPAVASRFTHIFQRRDGRWQMVAGQSTPLVLTL